MSELKNQIEQLKHTIACDEVVQELRRKRLATMEAAVVLEGIAGKCYRESDHKWMVTSMDGDDAQYIGIGRFWITTGTSNPNAFLSRKEIPLWEFRASFIKTVSIMWKSVMGTPMCYSSEVEAGK